MITPKSIFGCLLIGILVASASLAVSDGPSIFGAYYSKVQSDEEFEKYSRTGPHADIIVDMGDNKGQLIFWRGSSYLPYWKTAEGKWFVDEIIPRKGDGPKKRPDKVNSYSRVFIIESTSLKVVVHWRYLPEFSGTNPHIGVDQTKFVDEYYTITPNGKVTRTIREGSSRIDAWQDPLNKYAQTFMLAKDGIKDVKLDKPRMSEKGKPLKGSPVRQAAVREPAAWWKFDEGIGDETVESVSGVKSDIAGHKSLWRKGVSGTALQFDGYNSVIAFPAARAPQVSDGLTIEAWVAIGAYPWNWVPVVQQGDDDGYFLGLNGYGHPTIKVKIGDDVAELISDEHLERNRWYHIAGTYDKAGGVMKVYVDGKDTGTKKVAAADIKMAGVDVQIGKGKDRRPIDPVRQNTFIDSYSFDGLIDEVRIYNAALSSADVAKTYAGFEATDDIVQKPEMDARWLPSLKPSGKFQARYANLKFYDVWDNLWRFGDHPDVVVEFDELPSKFVFWRGCGYIPMMVNEKDQWYSNEFNETWSKSGGQGCQEPMSDKESYNNHAKIIENTPARVVVKWRYPLLDVLHVMANYDEKTGWCDWSEWYYYIYPDGVAVKKMRLYTHGERNHEWQESMAIFGPNQHPEQIIETRNAVTMLDLQGNYKNYNWIEGPPPNVRDPRGQRIQYINYTGEYDPVTIGVFEGSNVYGGELTPYAVFPTWNHWPVAQMPSDGRYASYPDRTAHSSLTHVFMPTYKEDHGDIPFQEKLLMEGMLKAKPLDLLPLAKSWLQPAGLKVNTGCDSAGYDPAQRAYVLTPKAEKMSFTIEASADSPLLNPCFVLKGWGSFEDEASLKVNGQEMAAGPDFRQGIIRDTDGTATKIIWIKQQSEKPAEIAISR